MTKHEKAEILQAIVSLAVAFERDISEDRMKIYLEDLKDLPVPDVLSAIHQARKTCKFFPSIAEIRELAGGGDDDPKAIWLRLRGMTNDVILYHLSDFSDEVRWAIRAMGGLGHYPGSFGYWEASQERAKERQFLALMTPRVREETQEIDTDHANQILKQLGQG